MSIEIALLLAIASAAVNAFSAATSWRRAAKGEDRGEAARIAEVLAKLEMIMSSLQEIKSEMRGMKGEMGDVRGEVGDLDKRLARVEVKVGALWEKHEKAGAGRA
jgi:archaellum component FlaC